MVEVNDLEYSKVKMPTCNGIYNIYCEINNFGKVYMSYRTDCRWTNEPATTIFDISVVPYLINFDVQVSNLSKN